MKKICSQSDVVITTAQVFGRPAPRIVTSEMVQLCSQVVLLLIWRIYYNVKDQSDEYVFENG